MPAAGGIEDIVMLVDVVLILVCVVVVVSVVVDEVPGRAVVVAVDVMYSDVLRKTWSVVVEGVTHTHVKHPSTVAVHSSSSSTSHEQSLSVVGHITCESESATTSGGPCCTSSRLLMTSSHRHSTRHPRLSVTAWQIG